MDILTAEEKLAAWIGETVEMTDGVFRTPLPTGVREGFEVKLVSGIPSGLDRVNEFTIEVTGYSPDRLELWRRFDRIFAALPLEKYSSFLYVDVGSEVKFSTIEKDGLLLACAVLNINASFV